MREWVEIDHVQILGRPKGQPRARSRRGLRGVYDPGTADSWKGDIQRAFAPWRRDHPLDEPLKVLVDFHFPRPKTFNKRTRDAYGATKKIPIGPVIFTAKPDPDNALKAVLDAMTDCGYMRDDAIVADVGAAKFYAGTGEPPGAVVTVYAWRDPLAWPT